MECIWQENQNPSVSACGSSLTSCNVLYFGFSLVKLCQLPLKHVDSDYTSNLPMDFAAQSWLHWRSHVSKYVYYHLSQYWSVNNWTEFVLTLYTVASVSYLQAVPSTPVSTHWVTITRIVIFFNSDWRRKYSAKLLAFYTFVSYSRCFGIWLYSRLQVNSSQWHSSFTSARTGPALGRFDATELRPYEGPALTGDSHINIFLKLKKMDHFNFQS